MDKIKERTGGVGGWTMDYEANAAYLQLSARPIVETLNFGVVNVDVDKNRETVGVELLTLQPLDR